jgi:hypothetical protein
MHISFLQRACKPRPREAALAFDSWLRRCLSTGKRFRSAALDLTLPNSWFVLRTLCVAMFLVRTECTHVKFSIMGRQFSDNDESGSSSLVRTYTRQRQPKVISGDAHCPGRGVCGRVSQVLGEITCSHEIVKLFMLPITQPADVAIAAIHSTLSCQALGDTCSTRNSRWS